MSGPADILVEIAAQRRRRLGTQGSPELAGAAPANRWSAAPESDRGAAFLAALRRGEPGRRIIAEVKLGSPRLGDLRARVEPERLAETYAAAGASALSVVVEPDYFHGSYELLERCRRASGLPTLAKDFLVDPGQLDAAAEAGAGAVLLIAALCDETSLAAWAVAARQRGLVPLVETHTTADVERLGGGPWELVGVNNRDLRTFEVDLTRAERLRPRLPEGATTVAESGLTGPREIERLAAAGFDAFLVGEALVMAEEPAEMLRRLVGTER